MSNQRFANFRTAAHDQIEDAGRASAFVQYLGNHMGTAWCQVSGLENNAIAESQRRRRFPGRNGNRKVPGRYNADNADRFAGDFNVDVGANGGLKVA